MEPKTKGRVAYEGYYNACGGKSLITGVLLPSWIEQSDQVRAAWEAAGQAVMTARDQEHDAVLAAMAEQFERPGTPAVGGVRLLDLARRALADAVESYCRRSSELSTVIFQLQPRPPARDPDRRPGPRRRPRPGRRCHRL